MTDQTCNCGERLWPGDWHHEDCPLYVEPGRQTTPPHDPQDARFCYCGAGRGHYGWERCKPKEWPDDVGRKATAITTPDEFAARACPPPPWLCADCHHGYHHHAGGPCGWWRIAFGTEVGCPDRCSAFRAPDA